MERWDRNKPCHRSPGVYASGGRHLARVAPGEPGDAFGDLPAISSPDISVTVDYAVGGQRLFGPGRGDLHRQAIVLRRGVVPFNFDHLLAVEVISRLEIGAEA